MKRIAAVLALVGGLTMGTASSANAASDPVHVSVCLAANFGCAPLADASVRKLLGPDAGAALCRGQQPGTEIPFSVPFDALNGLLGPLVGGIHGGVYGFVAICEP